jgi:hypothetical protein
MVAGLKSRAARWASVGMQVGYSRLMSSGTGTENSTLEELERGSSCATDPAGSLFG